ncbi:MAG TPA: hypothetical protein VFK66_07000 [Oryzihumus sp.]|nr:hypothetical protein [Oryzihumus sp.]
MVFGLPHVIDPLSHFYVKDVVGFVAVWFVIALIRTGVGALWRRRGGRDRLRASQRSIATRTDL